MLKRHPRAVLAALLLINVLAYVDRSLLYGFAPQITRDLGLDNTQFGLLSGAVWVLSYSVMVLVFGALADRHSRTRIIAGGMLLWCLCTAASGLAQDFGQMVMARLLVAGGEAALGPSATALLAGIFGPRRRATANGLFFMGIPLGIGCSYLLSGYVGEGLGWRGTFVLLGVAGAVVALCVALVRDEREGGAAQHGAPVLPQLRAVFGAVLGQPALLAVIAGFVLVHLVFAQSAFVQLWLVRERGADEAAMARHIGVLQILFGCLGAAGGGIAADRMAHGVRSALARVPVFSLLLCLPLMMASRVVGTDNPLLHAGLAASFFLPFSVYGSTLALVQGGVPPRMVASVMGLTMMSLNIVAMALGTYALGAISDVLARAGHAAPLTVVLLGSDAVMLLAIACYAAAARRLSRAESAVPVPD